MAQCSLCSGWFMAQQVRAIWRGFWRGALLCVACTGLLFAQTTLPDLPRPTPTIITVVTTPGAPSIGPAGRQGAP